MREKELDLTLSETIATQAAQARMAEKEKQKTYRIAIVCLTLLIFASIICGTVIAVRTIVEQQYAMNAQNASLYDLLAGAEVVETGDDGTIMQGNGNITTGGDVNGENN